MPRFKITQPRSTSLPSIVITDQETKAALRILPTFGGNIAGLTLAAAGECLTVVDGYRTLETASAHQGFRGALLFPFPNRICDGKYSFEGTVYQLPINRPKENCAIHGLFTHRSFELISEQVDDNGAEILIRSSYQGEEPGYPFPCEVTLAYRLDSLGSFRSIVSVTNRGVTNMPLGIGWHPYFSLGCPVDQLHLHLPASDILLIGPNNIPTGKKASMTQFQSPEPIACSLFDTALELRAADNHESQAVTELINEKDRWRLSLSQTIGHGGLNYLQLYIPPDRQTIALEPMTCPANSFNSGEGLISLAPEKSTSGTFEVSLSRTKSQ